MCGMLLFWVMSVRGAMHVLMGLVKLSVATCPY